MQRYERVWSSLRKKTSVINSAGWVWLFLRSTIQLHTHTCHLQYYFSVMTQFYVRKPDFDNIILLMRLFAWKIPQSSNVEMNYMHKYEIVAPWRCLKRLAWGSLVFCFSIFISLFLVSVYISTFLLAVSLNFSSGLHQEFQYFMLKFIYISVLLKRPD